MAVNSRDMSERDSRMDSASSELTASTEWNPASSTMSTARMRKTISSSTTRTFGTSVESADMGSLTLSKQPIKDLLGQLLKCACKLRDGNCSPSGSDVATQRP